jgi:hypothetical protein
MKATWDQPLRTALDEGFEDSAFPPPGWQSLTATAGYGWFRSNDASSSGFVIPPWDSYYAVVNNDTAGSANNGCCDYLITPPMDLRESDGYALYFDSFYTGAFGQLAFVEYSLDQGETWELLHQVMPDTAWTNIERDLSSFSGPEGPAQIWFAFHSDDPGGWSSGWAIDNVKVQVTAPPAGNIDYWVFLDGAFTGVTTQPAWDYAPLWYGQTYTASVAARYTSGLSAKAYYTFTSKFLFPPRNLAGNAPDDAAILQWDPPLEFWPSLTHTEHRDTTDDLPENLLGYNIYRDGVFIAYKDHVGGMEPQNYVEEDLDPGIYEYAVTGVYDLAPYGYEGETGESMDDGPAEVVVDYCYELEFLETWSMGNFGNNEWISEGENWKVNSHSGNPPPSVEFNWDPVQNDYSEALESYPLCAYGITEGNIWLDFDLALGIIQPTGGETLLAQVWNWKSRTWTTVADYSNAGGNFDWTAQHIDISDQAMNTVFKIRFVAAGVNSLDIRGWFIDNIHVYRTCPGPKDLTAEPLTGEGILLNWQIPRSSGLEGHSVGENGSRDLTGFNIYQSVDGGSYELLYAGQTGNEFVIPEDILVPGSFYCFKVNAIWTSGTDGCESDFSNEACAVWTSVTDEPGPGGASLNIYPNPADNHAFIIASEDIKGITIFNATGQQILDRRISGKQIELNTSGFSNGIYMVRLETSSGISTRKLTIQR